MLFASGAHISSFGAARGIKHLVLKMRDPHCGYLSSAMSVLEQLETLWLADATGRKVQQQQTSGGLQLSALRNLRSTMLESIVPESISCSNSCELHVDLEGVWSMEHPIWDTVLSHLRSVTLRGRSCDMVALPSILLKAGNLTRVNVMLKQCGTASAPLLLGGSLAHVEELVLDCVELHVVVPAHVTWRNIWVTTAHLNLRFEAVAFFGEAIPAFCIEFKTLQVCFPRVMLNLFIAVRVPAAPALHHAAYPALSRHVAHQKLAACAQGPALLELAAIVAKRPEWSDHESFCLYPSAHLEDPMTAMCFPMTQRLSNAWDALGRCRCGACRTCLCAAGIMH